MKNQYTCDECGAVYTLRHDMDELIYRVECCPFCRTGIDPDLVDELTDEEIDD